MKPLFLLGFRSFPGGISLQFPYQLRRVFRVNFLTDCSKVSFVNESQEGNEKRRRNMRNLNHGALSTGGYIVVDCVSFLKVEVAQSMVANKFVRPCLQFLE